MCLSLGDSGCHVTCLHPSRMRMRQSRSWFNKLWSMVHHNEDWMQSKCSSQSLDSQSVKDIIPSTKSSLVFKKSLCHWCTIMDPDWTSTSIRIHPNRVLQGVIFQQVMGVRSISPSLREALMVVMNIFIPMLISFRRWAFKLCKGIAKIFEFYRLSFYHIIV